MVEDMRFKQLAARRQAIGCVWLFLAIPGLLGIFVLLASGFSSAIGWILTAVYAVGTVYLAVLFARSRKLALAPMESRSGWIGWRKTS